MFAGGTYLAEIMCFREAGVVQRLRKSVDSMALENGMTSEELRILQRWEDSGAPESQEITQGRTLADWENEGGALGLAEEETGENTETFAVPRSLS